MHEVKSTHVEVWVGNLYLVGIQNWIAVNTNRALK